MTRPTDPFVLAETKYYPVIKSAHNRDKCEKCAFTTPKHMGASPECMAMPCQGIVWMTEPNYILHRLTS